MDESLLHSWQVDEHVHVISLKGEHDLTNVQELRDAIASAFQSGSTVILDLTDATLIDSMVLGAIAEARMELLGSGGRAPARDFRPPRYSRGARACNWPRRPRRGLRQPGCGLPGRDVSLLVSRPSATATATIQADSLQRLMCFRHVPNAEVS
jgi:hypothetical protein